MISPANVKHAAMNTRVANLLIPSDKGGNISRLQTTESICKEVWVSPDT